MVRPQHKPHHPRTPLSHTNTWEWRGRPSFLIVLFGVVGSPPMLWLYGTSKTYFCFGRPPDPLGALAADVVPNAPTASNGHNFMIQASNVSSDHSIGIYSLRRCQWTCHLPHSDKYSLSCASLKLRDSQASLPGLCYPSLQHSQSWALSLGNTPLKTP